MTPLRFGIAILAVCMVMAASVRGVESAGPPSHAEAPLFFQLFSRDYSDSLNRELLPQGRVRLSPLGIERIDDFDWVNHRRIDASWWQRMESCTYLLPLLDAGSPADIELARRWFVGWRAAHEDNFTPNAGALDAMSVGTRAMVFVRLLAETERLGGDAELEEAIRTALRWHQDFLANPDHFSDNSNHGMWEALGLFEASRVTGERDMTALALERLLKIVAVSVSDRGIHREHSPSYHFHFLRWLADFVRYFDALAPYVPPGASALEQTEEKMRSASYFLYDHDYKLPQIGDTDAGEVVDARFRSEAPAERYIFDREAGYAIYKDPAESKWRRYVFFCNQNAAYPPKLPYHIHNDVLGVVFDMDGEVILGDQGRYSYTRTAMRAYLMSVAAHNTIFPASMIVPKEPGIYTADETWLHSSWTGVKFGASMRDGAVTREVRISRGGSGMRVEDTVTDGEHYLLLWHVGPDVIGLSPTSTDGTGDRRHYQWVLRTKSGKAIELRIDVQGRSALPGPEVTVVEGQERPLLGWYSKGYNEFEPSKVIKLELRAVDRLRVITRVGPPRTLWERLLRRY